MQVGRQDLFTSALVRSTTAKLALLLMFILSTPLIANATTTYEYQGNNFDTFLPEAPGSSLFTTDMQISVTAVFTDPLPENLDRQAFAPGPGSLLLSFEMNDGRGSGIFLNGPTPEVAQSFIISTDGQGNIFEWDVVINEVVGSTQSILATHFFEEAASSGFDFSLSLLCESFPNCSAAMVDRGRIDGSKGTWTEVSAPPVPESSTALLLGGGLVGLAARRRRKQA